MCIGRLASLPPASCTNTSSMRRALVRPCCACSRTSTCQDTGVYTPSFVCVFSARTNCMPPSQRQTCGKPGVGVCGASSRTPKFHDTGVYTPSFVCVFPRAQTACRPRRGRRVASLELVTVALAAGRIHIRAKASLLLVTKNTEPSSGNGSSACPTACLHLKRLKAWTNAAVAFVSCADQV